MSACWLFKTEPLAFSLEDLESRPQQTEPWDGVRNYQARNFMRDRMKIGDKAFFYHSNCKTPGIVGIVTVASPGYPDPTQFDPDAGHYDPKSRQEEPRWYLVDVHFERRTERLISLAELRTHADADALSGFPLVARGNRLSVMPVRAEHWAYILKLEKQAPPE